MSFAQNYLAKQDQRFLITAPKNLKSFELVVVIPCYNEPDIQHTIHSLYNCNNPGFTIAIAVVVNNADNANPIIKTQNQQTIYYLAELSLKSPAWISLYAIDSTNLPSKHAGVGWARKIGMDWAVSYYNQTDKPQGIIVTLDADTLVEANYFEAVFSFYKVKPEAIGATIYFEHPLTNNETGEAITWYELYMRYYKYALKYTGFPHSIYTVGSCITVKAKAYVAQGGMNRRKAGEDFYFLHKMVQLGKLEEINNTTIHPSSRVSDRVPFGTGHAVQKYLDEQSEFELTYPLEAFIVLKDFFTRINSFYSIKKITYNDLSANTHFLNFLNTFKFIDELNELIANCSTLSIFKRRFFHLFNAFRILKWLNFALSNGFEKNYLIAETQKLFIKMRIDTEKRHDDPKLLLKLLRQVDKTQSFD